MKTINKLKIVFKVFFISCFFVTSLSAQPAIDRILQNIEQNNTTLAALREKIDAEKIGNKTGIYLQNPEVEFHYLWGSKNEIGNRTDISALQGFDFPTAYHYKQKISEEKNIHSDMKYGLERINILLRAKQVCIELIYLNALNIEYQKRLDHAQQIANAYQSQFDKGEVNILDRNKAYLNLMNADKEIKTGRANRQLLISELTTLNGGNPISFELTEYLPVLLPDFETWYASTKDKNGTLSYLQQTINLSKQNEKLQRSMNLPKFSAGYMSEKVMNEQFQGVVVGVSIPLWENKNTVRQIKKQTQAYQLAQQDATLQNYNRMKALFEKAQELQRISTSYRTTLASINNSELLKKALNAGEISLINYIIELGIYYDAVNQVLETEKEFQLLATELRQWEL